MSSAGIKYLLKTPGDSAKAIQSDPPAKADFMTIAGIRSNSENNNIALIEKTSKSSNFNREYLEGAGVLSLDISGSGVLQADVLTADLQQTFYESKARWFLIESANGDLKIAKCVFADFTITGVHDGVVEFTFSLNSSGTIYRESSTGVKWNSGNRLFTDFQSTVDPYNIITRLSPAYALANIPANKQTAFDAYLTGQNILNANKVSKGISSDNTITGDTANQYKYPIFLLLKSEVTGKRVQVIDVAMLPIRAFYIGEYQDDTNAEWLAYYLDQPLGNNESISFSVEIWN